MIPNELAFARFMAWNLPKYLPPEYQSVDIDIQTIRRLNEEPYIALTVKRSEKAAAVCMHMESWFERYQQSENGERIIAEFVQSVVDADQLLNRETEKELRYDLLDYTSIRDDLRIQLCDFRQNEDYLLDHAWVKPKDFGAYAATFYIVPKALQDLSKDGADRIIRVTNGLLKSWGVDAGTVYRDALIASKETEKPVVTYIEDTILETLQWRKAENLYETGEIDEGSILILQSSAGARGASIILRDDVQQNLGKLIGDDYFILPSSIHELILIPESIGMSDSYMREMVENVNMTVVHPEDRLSNQILYYDRQQGHIIPATTRHERTRMQGRENRDISNRRQEGREL